MVSTFYKYIGLKTLALLGWLQTFQTVILIFQRSMVYNIRGSSSNSMSIV